MSIDNDDPIVRIFAESQGKNIKDVEMWDVNKKKKKKVKNRSKKNKNKDDNIEIGNAEGLKILYDKKAKEIDFSTKKIPKRRCLTYDKNKPVDEWNNRDLVGYAHSLYVKRLKKDWILREPAAALEINKIRDEISPLFGDARSSIIKDYIDFFFDNFLLEVVKKNGDFYFSNMRNRFYIESFYNFYDLEAANNKYAEQYEKIEKEKNKFCLEQMDISNLISIEKLLYDYGIVLSYQYLRMQNFSHLKVLQMITKSCINISSQDWVDKIIEETQKNQPYPLWIKIKDYEVNNIYDKISRNIKKVNIEYVKDNKKYNFLRI